MGRYFIRRILYSFLVLFGVSLLVFVTMRLSGDPVQLLLRDGNPTQEDIERLRRALKLDRPLAEQYLAFVASAVQGDFGESLRYRTPALDEVMSRMPATIQLSVAAYLFALLVAIPTGIVSAVKRGGVADFASRFVSLIGVSFPSFWLGLMLILIFSVRLKWLPVSGRGEGFEEQREGARLAGGDAGDGLRGDADAVAAVESAGGAESGLHPDGAGEGAARARRCWCGTRCGTR